MRRIDLLKALIIATGTCAAISISGAQAEQTIDKRNTVPLGAYATADDGQRKVAARDMTERYFKVYRLIGSHVLNLAGQRIGQVENLVLNDRGNITRVIVALSKSHDGNAGAIAISPQRTEVISTDGAYVTVIRVDMTREEILQAQIMRLKPNARAPAQRGAGMPEMHRETRPLY